MGWDRQPPPVVVSPAPVVLGRWVVAAGAAGLSCVLLFLLSASGRVLQLQGLNIWALTASPMLAWVLVFAARAYFYGRALEDQQFLEEETLVVQQSWQDWAQRHLAVIDSCVLLPDQVSASTLVQERASWSPRPGLARRIATLPLLPEGRAGAGVRLLFPAVAPALQALPPGQELQVTLLSDIDPQHHEALRDDWQQAWASALPSPPAALTLISELSYQWIDEKLKSANPAFELILVLQVQGGAGYSDGLAALLLCPDQLARAHRLSVRGGLLRPMPLDINALDSELPLFLHTQACARQATGLLADSTRWQALTGQVITASATQGASLEVEQQWTQELFCGLPGPFSSWLTAALGVAVARHQQRPLVLLTEEASRQWIATTVGEQV